MTLEDRDRFLVSQQEAMTAYLKMMRQEFENVEKFVGCSGFHSSDLEELQSAEKSVALLSSAVNFFHDIAKKTHRICKSKSMPELFDHVS